MKSSSQNPAAFSLYFCPQRQWLWLAGIPWTRSAHPLMCQLSPVAVRTVHRTQLHINTCSNSPNKGSHGCYFHFATVSVYKFLQLGQVFLHILFALLFLQQQVKKKKPFQTKTSWEITVTLLTCFKTEQSQFPTGRDHFGSCSRLSQSCFPSCWEQLWEPFATPTPDLHTLAWESPTHQHRAESWRGNARECSCPSGRSREVRESWTAGWQNTHLGAGGQVWS